MDDDIQNMEIWQLINQLEEPEKKILILYYWWGYTDQEIGEKLNQSQQGIHYHRKKGIRLIKNQFL